LARLGIDVTVFDKNSEVAAEASGNRWGMMYPLITKKIDRLGTLTKSGCAFTRNQLQNLNLTIKEGLLEYATDEGKVKRLEQGLERLPKDYIKQLSANDITSEFSFDSAHGAVYHQQAATFSPKDYCQILLESKLFKCELDSELEELTRLDENWQLKFLDGREEKFDSVVLATAYATKNFAATEHLPLRVTRGQVASIPKEAVNQDVKTGLNFVNYLVQDGEDDYVLGATFQVDDHGQDFRPEDNVELLESIQKFFPGLVKDLDPLTLSGRVCFRAVLKDYFPLVGPVCDLETYKETFEAIKFGRPKHQYDEPPYKEGLYVLAGLGARGLSTASLLGTYLARLIVDGVSILPEEHITATHPSRFILKELKKS